MKLAINRMFLTTILLFSFQASWGQFRIRTDEYIQIGYNNYRTLTFGTGTSSPNNGAWGIEHWQGGLNFWKPWPNNNWNNYILFLRDDNNIGIGFQGLYYFRLAVQGRVVAQQYWIFSDMRFKEDVKPLTSALNKVLKLQPKSYYFNSDALNSAYSSQSIANDTSLTETKRQMLNQELRKSEEKKEKNIGLIAQEVRDVVPEVVREDERGYLSIDYMALVPVLIEAIKEQQSQIEQLKKQVGKLERTVAELKKKK